MNTPASAIQPISLEQARRQRWQTSFIDSWLRRTVKHFGPINDAEMHDLRSAAHVGALLGQQRWHARPEPERTEDAWKALVARAVRSEVRAAWHRMGHRPKGKREAALKAAIPTVKYAHGSIQERLQDMQEQAFHGVFAGITHGSLGRSSPEDDYITREAQKLDHDRIQFALHRLEDPRERAIAQELLIHGRTLTEACATVGIHDKSARTRIRKTLFKKIRQHAVVFASSRGPLRSRGDGSSSS